MFNTVGLQALDSIIIYSSGFGKLYGNYICYVRLNWEQNNWTYNTFGLVIQRMNFSKIKIMDGDECYMTY
jgi:hypothetical protein